MAELTIGPIEILPQNVATSLIETCFIGFLGLPSQRCGGQTRCVADGQM